MMERLFPRMVDNDYRGHPVALWVLVPVTLLTLVRSLIHMFRVDGGAQSIATIPLDRYSDPAAAAVILIFALWGLSQLLLGLLYVVVLVRYRALIPLMYLTLILEYCGRLALGAWKPMETLERPPGARFTLIMIVLSLVMFVLSLRQRPSAA
ncbi:MAG: hypothetical protein VCB42_12320 [Myxococcota bacterium]